MMTRVRECNDNWNRFVITDNDGDELYLSIADQETAMDCVAVFIINDTAVAVSYGEAIRIRDLLNTMQLHNAG